jgi:hypothetical protein
MNHKAEPNPSHNPNPEPQPGAKPAAEVVAEVDVIDRILCSDEPLVPSSGFLSSVMSRVHEEAAAPPPIPFPWKRALPGILLLIALFVWGAYQLIRYLPLALRQISFAAPHLSAGTATDLTQAGWVALACAVSLLSWLLSIRLAQRS